MITIGQSPPTYSHDILHLSPRRGLNQSSVRSSCARRQPSKDSLLRSQWLPTVHEEIPVSPISRASGRELRALLTGLSRAVDAAVPPNPTSDASGTRVSGQDQATAAPGKVKTEKELERERKKAEKLAKFEQKKAAAAAAAATATVLSDSEDCSSFFKTLFSTSSLPSLSHSLSLFRPDIAGGSEPDQFPASRGKLRIALEPRILKAARS